MDTIKELESILYAYLKESSSDEFIYIQRIIDIVLRNKRHFECKKFNSHIDLRKSLTLVYNFLEQLNLNYQTYFEDRINDKTFSFDQNYEFGYCYYDEKVGKRILIPINCNIHDGFVTIHELIHSMNLKVGSDSITRHLFTESISILAEMLFHDYLIKNKLYVHDAKMNLKNIFESAQLTTMKNDFEVKLALQYLGNQCININEIKDLSSSNDDDYNWQIYYSITDAVNKKYLELDIDQRYSIGIVFASYMHDQILENNKNIKKFFELNDIINNITVEELMSYLDLTVEDSDNTILTYDSIGKLEKSYKKELKRLG